jgi:hypothetical protein
MEERSGPPGEGEGVVPRDLEPSIGELEGLVSYAERRVALYRRRVYAGAGEPTRLAELERVHAGARKRLERELARERQKAKA